MSDRRFYRLHAPLEAGRLAMLAGAKLVHGDDAHVLSDVAALADAGPHTVCFVRDGALLSAVTALDAGLYFCPPELVDPLLARGAGALAVHTRPDAAFYAAAAALVDPLESQGEHKLTAPDSTLEDGVQVGDGASIGPGAYISEGTVIGPGAVIGAGCVIGKNCAIGANAVVHFTVMGDRVDIRPGAVLGEAGLGVIGGADGLMDVPHFGIIRLGDGVRIGANSAIDRAVFGETVIGARSKVDNLVQIAHNVQIGTDCVLASLCGVAGSAVLGNGVLMGGRAGVADHVQIGDNARIGAAAAVMKNVPQGETWGGHPARPMRQYMREQVALKKLAQRGGGSHDPGE